MAPHFYEKILITFFGNVKVPILTIGNIAMVKSDMMGAVPCIDNIVSGRAVILAATTIAANGNVTDDDDIFI